jgi:D-amino-acid dehydrogenase
VGAGIIGLTTSYHLLKEGHEVTLLDVWSPGVGASHGNAGWIVPCDVSPVPAPGMVLKGLKWMLRGDSPLYVRPSLQPDFVRFMYALARRCNESDFRTSFEANMLLCQGTMQMLDDYRADGVDFEMHRKGLLMVYADETGLKHHIAQLDIPARAGLDPAVLTGEELAEREPALRPSLAGAVYYPLERHVRPDELVSALAKRCRELGATILERSPLLGVHRNRRVLALDTPRGQVEADVYVLAAGAHSGVLSRLFGARLPIRAGKGYSVDYCPAPVGFSSMVNLADAKVAITPLAGRLRLSGTMEFAGLDASINCERVKAIQAAPVRYFTEWDRERRPAFGPWAGARPMTPDGLPIIGRLPGLTNAWVATGHGMLGVTLGPATGRALTTAIGTGAVPDMLAPFSPTRFLNARGGWRVSPRRISQTTLAKDLDDLPELGQGKAHRRHD